VTTRLLHPIPEACHLLGIGRTKFYAEVAAGRITIVKIGDKSLVPHRSIEAYEAMLIAAAEAARSGGRP
jgi:excisionase family DNA binding protein